MSKIYSSFVGTPIEFEAPIGPRRGQLAPAKFSAVARALWPRKTAAHLAAAAHVHERAAKRWLAGSRQPSPSALRAIIDELFD